VTGALKAGRQGGGSVRPEYSVDWDVEELTITGPSSITEYTAIRWRKVADPEGAWNDEPASGTIVVGEASAVIDISGETWAEGDQIEVQGDPLYFAGSVRSKPYAPVEAPGGTTETISGLTAGGGTASILLSSYFTNASTYAIASVLGPVSLDTATVTVDPSAASEGDLVSFVATGSAPNRAPASITFNGTVGAEVTGPVLLSARDINGDFLATGNSVTIAALPAIEEMLKEYGETSANYVGSIIPGSEWGGRWDTVVTPVDAKTELTDNTAYKAFKLLPFNARCVGEKDYVDYGYDWFDLFAQTATNTPVMFIQGQWLVSPAPETMDTPTIQSWIDAETIAADEQEGLHRMLMRRAINTGYISRWPRYIPVGRVFLEIAQRYLDGDSADQFWIDELDNNIAWFAPDEETDLKPGLAKLMGWDNDTDQRGENIHASPIGAFIQASLEAAVMRRADPLSLNGGDGFPATMLEADEWLDPQDYSIAQGTLPSDYSQAALTKWQEIAWDVAKAHAYTGLYSDGLPTDIGWTVDVDGESITVHGFPGATGETDGDTFYIHDADDADAVIYTASDVTLPVTLDLSSGGLDLAPANISLSTDGITPSTGPFPIDALETTLSLVGKSNGFAAIDGLELDLAAMDDLDGGTIAPQEGDIVLLLIGGSLSNTDAMLDPISDGGTAGSILPYGHVYDDDAILDGAPVIARWGPWPSGGTGESPSTQITLAGTIVPLPYTVLLFRDSGLVGASASQSRVLAAAAIRPDQTQGEVTADGGDRDILLPATTALASGAYRVGAIAHKPMTPTIHQPGWVHLRDSHELEDASTGGNIGLDVYGKYVPSGALSAESFENLVRGYCDKAVSGNFVIEPSAAAVATFSEAPYGVSGLALWLDAVEPRFRQMHGTGVKMLADRAHGRSFTPVVSASPPVMADVDGVAAMQFDNSEGARGLVSNTTAEVEAITGDLTIIGCLEPLSVGGAVFSLAGAGANALALRFAGTGEYDLQLQLDGSLYRFGTASFSLAGSGAQVFAIRVNLSGDSQAYVAGATVSDTVDTSAATMTLGTGQNFVIGDAVAQDFNLHDLLIYTRLLSDADLNTVANYIATARGRAWADIV
jgi:hypothetical protein